MAPRTPRNKDQSSSSDSINTAPTNAPSGQVNSSNNQNLAAQPLASQTSDMPSPSTLRRRAHLKRTSSEANLSTVTTKRRSTELGRTNLLEPARNAEGVEQDPVESKYDTKELLQIAKVLYFYHMDLNPELIRPFVPQYVHNESRAWTLITIDVEKWRTRFQGAIWGSTFFLNHVEQRVSEYDSNAGPGEKYADLSIQQRGKFWLDKKRFNKAFLLDLFKPLKKAIDMVAIADSPMWAPFISRVFIVACQSTWEYRIQWKHTPSKYDKLQTYQDIRSYPAHLEARGQRPPFGDLPLSDAGIAYEGRRGIRQEDPQLSQIEFGLDEALR